VERPLVAVEAAEAVALELAHDGVRHVAVEGVGAGEEDLAHQLRLRHRQPRVRSEPYQERRACTMCATTDQPAESIEPRSPKHPKRNIEKRTKAEQFREREREEVPASGEGGNRSRGCHATKTGAK
jgi:hypothetical protein